MPWCQTPTYVYACEIDATPERLQEQLSSPQMFVVACDVLLVAAQLSPSMAEPRLVAAQTQVHWLDETEGQYVHALRGKPRLLVLPSDTCNYTVTN
jgi:hypothetical protein